MQNLTMHFAKHLILPDLHYCANCAKLCTMCKIMQKLCKIMHNCEIRVFLMSTFWSRLHRLIGTNLRLSSAYHPQSDGSTERANRTVTQMLRQCIQPDQKDWVSRLPAIEFAINCARSESTGFAPFFLNFGRMPRSMIWSSAVKDEYPAVRDFALKKKLALMSAHDSIVAA
jgi:hypothetical protein